MFCLQPTSQSPINHFDENSSKICMLQRLFFQLKCDDFIRDINKICMKTTLRCSTFLDMLENSLCIIGTARHLIAFYSNQIFSKYRHNIFIIYHVYTWFNSESELLLNIWVKITGSYQIIILRRTIIKYLCC